MGPAFPSCHHTVVVPVPVRSVLLRTWNYAMAFVDLMFYHHEVLPMLVLEDPSQAIGFHGGDVDV